MIFLVFFKNLFFLFYFSFLLASVNKKKRKLYFELKKQKTCSQAISDQAIFVGILVWHTLKTGTHCVKNSFNMESQATGSLFHKSWLCCFSIFFSQLENQSVTVFKQCWKQQLWFLSHCITHSESRHKKPGNGLATSQSIGHRNVWFYTNIGARGLSDSLWNSPQKHG